MVSPLLIPTNLNYSYTFFLDKDAPSMNKMNSTKCNGQKIMKIRCVLLKEYSTYGKVHNKY